MKRSKHQDHFDTRRNFLCHSACASLGVTSVVNTLAHLRLVQSAAAQATPPTDYKALVCLFLYGGNDSNNMLVPLNGIARDNYNAARPASNPMHISPSAALSLNAPQAGFGQTTASQFGLHPAMTRSRQMFNDGQLAFVANTGTLVVPIERADYIAVPRLKPVPPQLFSHSDQQVQWQSSLPDRPFQSGWGGRAADLLHGLANPSSQVSMNISIAGQNSYQVGSSTVQYAVSTAGVVGLSGYSNSTGNYGNAANYGTTPPTYTNNDAGRTLRAVDVISKLTRMQLGETDAHYQNLLEDGYNDVMKRARDNEAIVGTALSLNAQIINDTFDSAFGWAGGSAPRPTLPDVANQLKMVVRLMLGRNDLNVSRQIFFVSMGGYDTHRSQLLDHQNLLDTLDKALLAFKNAVSALSLWNSTLLFSNSDFSRTFQPNGTTDTSGTDHGWGGHQIIMGGPVIGGRIYGTFPDLARSAGQDVDSNRGRWIPTTAVEQYASVAAKWFMSQGSNYLGGLTNDHLATIFPNLGRFQNVSSIPSNLQYANFNL
jgi:uncharacterized protein (DUF1501 family)